MTKQEFDKASEEAGFGRSADYIWDEIERCYSSSDRIDRDLMVDIYWHEPGIYRTILEKRYEATQLARSLEAKTKDYQFAGLGTSVKALEAILSELDYAIDSAIYRRMKRETKGGKL